MPDSDRRRRTTRPAPCSTQARRPAQPTALASCPPRLLAAARLLRPTRPEAAFGRCLYLSLELARVARRLGVPVRLVHWTLRDDPSFRDHWAVEVAPDVVLDLTRIQVDGSTRLLNRLADYPVGFGRPQHYPAEPVLRHYEPVRGGVDGRLPAGFQRTLRRLMLCHDWQQARQDLAPGRALLALRDHLAFHLLHRAARLHESLLWRESALRGRLPG